MYFLRHIFGQDRRFFGDVRHYVFRYYSDSRGYVLIATSVFVGVLSIVVGFAIDYSLAISDKNRLHSAVDSAALFLSSEIYADSEEAESRALDYVRSNFSDLSSDKALDNFSVSVEEDTISVCVDYNKRLYFHGILSRDSWDLHICSEAKRSFEAIEVVMVLDNTGSMKSELPGDNVTRMDALKRASKDLVKILYDSVPDDKINFTGDSLLKIGLVPFAGTVNVGREHADSFWVRNQPLQYSPDGEDGMPVDDLFDVLRTEWYGCVEARLHDYDLDDTPPSRHDPDTLWSKYFYPDEPDFTNNWHFRRKGCWGNSKNRDGHSYFNNYLYDFRKGSLHCMDKDYAGRLARVEKYDFANRLNLRRSGSDSSKRYNDPSETGPNYRCVEPIIALTDEKDRVLSALDGMVARGFTIIPFGLVWGWRVLSPGDPFSEGRDYDDNVRKILILLTDGQNSIPSSTGHVYDGFYTAYGFVDEKRYQSSESSVFDETDPTAFLDEKTSRICDRIKDAGTAGDGGGIEIFTISFGLVSSTAAGRQTKRLLENCASGEDYYFDAANADALQVVFRDIAAKLGKVRISR